MSLDFLQNNFLWKIEQRHVCKHNDMQMDHTHLGKKRRNDILLNEFLQSLHVQPTLERTVWFAHTLSAVRTVAAAPLQHSPLREQRSVSDMHFILKPNNLFPEPHPLKTKGFL